MKKVYRTNKSKGNFTQIDNAFLFSDKLTPKAKIIFTILLALPDDFNPTIKHIQKRLNRGYDFVRSGLNELIEQGYLDEIEVSPELKQYRCYDYIVYESGKSNVLNESNGIQKNQIGYSTNPNTNNTIIKDIYIKDLNIIRNDLLDRESLISKDLKNHNIKLSKNKYTDEVNKFITHLEATEKYLSKTKTECREWFVNKIKQDYNRLDNHQIKFKPQQKPTATNSGYYKKLG